jgi:hypothetical protein
MKPSVEEMETGRYQALFVIRTGYLNVIMNFWVPLKDDNFSEQPSDYQLLKDSVP